MGYIEGTSNNLRVDMTTALYRTLAVTACITLTGCITMTNLADPGSGLADKDRLIAQKMAKLASDLCITVVTYGDQTLLNKAKKQTTISRLWNSNTKWYRAEGRMGQTIDYFYFNEETGQFGCGEKGWRERPESKLVAFQSISP
jgi:hypothetical protein